MSTPRLYEANEATKSNAFQSLGIGTLGDAISCIITEERNGTYELEMEYPVEGKRFSDLKNDRLILAKASERGNEQIFRIYKIEKPIDGKVTVSAEHISYLLNKVICLPFEATSANSAFQQIKSNLLWQSNNVNFKTFPFDFWTDSGADGQIKIEKPTAVRSILGGEDGSVLDAIGGDYEFDNFTVKLHTDRGSDSNIYLRYGKNITDLEDTDDISGVYTGIVPYWSGSLQRKTTDEDGQEVTESYETTIYINDKVLWSDYTSSYAYPMATVVDFSSDIEINDDAENEVYTTEEDIRKELQTQAETYLKNNKGWTPSNNIEVSFAQLWQTEEYKNYAALQRVGMCDTVHVVYPVLNVDVAMRVIKTEYNVLLERYESLELGDSKTSMTSDLVNNQKDTDQKIAEQALKTASDLQKAVTYATDMINGKINILTGANTAYVVFNRNAKGGINEILIMDNEDKNKAVNVWRWNGGGLGHSHSGYNGPFDDVAITQDGRINANYITTGMLTSVLIRTASTGKRIVITNGDGAIFGYNNDTLRSVIDMVNDNGDMLIDSASTLQIRTPALYVEGASHGDATSTTYKANTGTLKAVQNVMKWGSWESDGSAPEQLPTEINFADFSNYNVYCTLPAKLKVYYNECKFINGFLTTTETKSTDWY